jgi:transposase
MSKKRRGKNEVHAPMEEKVRDFTMIVPASQAKCRFEGMMEFIRKIVHEVNAVTLHANMLALAHVTRCMHVDSELPILNDSFYSSCYRVLSKSVHTDTLTNPDNQSLLDTMELLWGVRVGWLNTANHKNMAQIFGNSMDTAHGNYDNIALFDHMVPYIQAKYGIKMKGNAKHLCGRITKENDSVYTEEDTPYGLRERTDLSQIVATERELFRQAFVPGSAPTASKSEKYERRRRLLLYRRMMQQTILQNSTDERSYRNFSLIPVHDIGVKFIDIDFTTMLDLCSRFVNEQCTSLEARIRRENTGISKTALKNLIVQSKKEFRSNTLPPMIENAKNFRHWFRVPRKGQEEWVLGRTFRTNGYEFHFLYEKNKIRGPKRACRVPRSKQMWESDWDPEYTYRGGVGPSEAQNFAACDVGHHNLVTSISPTYESHQNGTFKFEKRNFSKKRYNHESKRTKVLKKWKRIARKADVRVMLHALTGSSLKTPEWETLAHAIRTRSGIYPRLYQYYNNKQFLKLKAEARMAARKTIDSLIHWITWGGSKPIGWGDGSKNTGFRGTSPGGPLKKIRRHAVKKGYNVTLVNEYRTSKSSPCCVGHDMARMIGPKKDGSRGPVHGVSICQGCGKTWDRDFAASVNIFDCFYNTQVNVGERPFYLRRYRVMGTRPLSGTWFSCFTYLGLESLKV